jgi:hypothetical protein
VVVKLGVEMIMAFVPTRGSASWIASNIQVLVWGHIMVSTPALRNTSIISAMAFVFVTMRSVDLLFASVQWVYPRNQFVPIIILETDSWPTFVLGKADIITTCLGSNDRFLLPLLIREFHQNTWFKL